MRPIYIIALVVANVRVAQSQGPTEQAREFTLRPVTAAAAVIGLPPMTREDRHGAPDREVRISVDYSRKKPSFLLRIVDSAKVVRAERILWWSGRSSVYGSLVDMETGKVVDLPADPDDLVALRTKVHDHFACEPVRKTLVIEACRLSDYPPGSAPHLLDALIALGVTRLQWNVSLVPDGGMMTVESWDGRAYRWYFYGDADAQSLDPSVRAAAEITQRVRAIFVRDRR